MRVLLLAIAVLLVAPMDPALAARPPRLALVLDRQTQKTVWQEVAQGAQLAIDEIRASGGKLEVNEYDSGTSAVGTRTEMLKAIKTAPDLIVAEIDSSKAAVAAEIAESNHRVLITPFATSPRVTEGKKYVFRACVPDNVIGGRLAKYARSRNSKRIAIVYDGGQLYSVTLREEFKKAFVAQGGEVAIESSILSTTNSFESVATSIVAAKPDLVFLPFYEETVGRFLAQAAKVPGFGSLELLGGDGWANGAFFTSGSGGDLTTLKGTWVTHHDPNHSTPEARSFVARFKKKFGRAPETSSAFLGYDSVRLGYEAIKHFPGGTSSEKILDTLKNHTIFHGVTGNIVFSHGNDPDKALFLIRHESGESKTIGGLF